MSIDWITVAAQIANFLVLVWLLKRFLYRPILDGIDAREAEITTRMQEAGQAGKAAQAAEAAFLEKTRALQATQSDLTETIRTKAEEQRDALLSDARQRMEQEHASWRAHLDQETRDYTARMHGAGASALLSLTRKALADLADETLEERMAHHLVRKIRTMSTDLKRAAGKATGAVVTSHASLPQSAQEGLTGELATVFPHASVRFDTDTGQSPGVILRMGGAQLAWTVDTYIDGLDAAISEKLANGTDLRAQDHEH